MAGLLPSSGFNFQAILRSGDHVAWPQATGEPTGLTHALLRKAEGLPKLTLVLGMVTTTTLDHAAETHFEYLCLNGAANTRKAAVLSANRVVPAHVSAIPDLIRSGRLKVDVVLIRVRPTTNPSVLSLGVNVDFVHEMIETARIVVAEVDERMPLTAADALVDRERITHFTLADGVEPLIADPEPSDSDKGVARRVADLVPDRATVQFGVGGVPVAICRALLSHKDLGLHSGVISDAAVELIESGVITNRFKGLDGGVSVTGGLFGTRRLFEFAHANPQLAMRRATYTHSARTFAKLANLYTINSAVSVDLSGQVNSEVALGRYVGAVGGQVDFVRGARLSVGGRSIIALASVTLDGKHSKIVAALADQPVTTARSDVDLIVTEHGVADLWGADLHQRAESLIRIAHPDFRDLLARSFEESLSKNR